MSFGASSNASAVSSELRLAADKLEALEAPTREAGEMVARAPAPRRSGQLGSGVTVAGIPGGVAVASTVDYFTYVHYGAPGRNIRAQPWLARELASDQDRILDLYTEHASQALAQVKG